MGINDEIEAKTQEFITDYKRGMKLFNQALAHEFSDADSAEIGIVTEWVDMAPVATITVAGLSFEVEAIYRKDSKGNVLQVSTWKSTHSRATPSGHQTLIRDVHRRELRPYVIHHTAIEKASAYANEITAAGNEETE